MKREVFSSGFAAHQCGKALPFRPSTFLFLLARLRLANVKRRHSLLLSLAGTTVRRRLTALSGGTAARPGQHRPRFAPGLQHLSLLLSVAVLASVIHFTTSSHAQTRSPRGAHSAPRETYTPADRALVERAIGVTCAERARDPLGSMPIDEMQTRPSLPVSNPDALAGARRAERLLPTTKRLVADTIVQLAKDYDLYATALARGRVSTATARVEAVRRIKPDVDSRDNASVLLRDPRVIDFGTIFLAGLRSDEGMVSVLAHELTHIASGQPDSLRLLFRAIARRAAARTGLRIQGQRAEELGCDLVGVMTARAYIKQTPSWEPLPRRLARALEHNCVDDDASDEDHLSPRNTIRALFALDVSLATEELSEGGAGASWIGPRLPLTPPIMLTASTRSP
jgi:hypothetical protein